MSDSEVSLVASTHFSAVLLPHRSLGRKGFVILMSVISGLSFLTGLAFYLRGAWPVMGFFGLDVLLIYGAFRMNYRAALLYETVELTERELKVTRVHPSGQTESWTFNPYWVQLQLEESETTANRLSLRSHGRALALGRFLSDDEKRGFADALGAALYDLRGSRI